MSTSKEFNADEWLAHANAYEGYCTKCKDWTREQTEPDAEGYDCPECKQLTVVGSDVYLLLNT
jgi:Zn finger protein HypA/HybF involved in hydrogenase expression